MARADLWHQTLQMRAMTPALSGPFPTGIPGTGWFAIGSGKRVLVAGLAAALLALLPILAAHHLPLLDAPGHESRLAVLRDLLITRTGSRHYELDGFFLPNIAFDVIGLGLVSVLDPETAGQLFFALTLCLTLAGTVVLNRQATGRWSVVPLVCTLMLYNLISILGFFSYAFGLALVPWMLTARLGLEHRTGIAPHLIGAAMGALLLFCHAFDFGIYATMSGGFALAALFSRRIRLGRAVAWAAEVLPGIALYFLMATHGQGRIRYEPHLLYVKLLGIVKCVTGGSMTGDIAFLVGAAAFLALLLLCARVRLARQFLPGLIGLVVLYAILPAELESGSYVDKRMPIAVAFMLVAALDIRIRPSRTAVALIGVVVAALVVKQAAIAILWRSYDPLIDRITATLAGLPDGAVIMQAECEPESNAIRDVYRERQPSMTHLAAFASFDDRHFIPATWAIKGQQPVRVNQGFDPYYRLQTDFGPSTCRSAGYKAELTRIRDLAAARAAKGGPVPPLYFFLIRPPETDSLVGLAPQVAKGPDWELYRADG